MGRRWTHRRSGKHFCHRTDLRYKGRRAAVRGRIIRLSQLSLAVVGADYPNKGKSPTRRFEIALCKPGEPVELIPEPKNPADPRAVAVFSSRGIQLGYLTAERCGRIGALIRQVRDVRAVFQEATRYGAVIRVAFDGEEPVLPPERPSEPSEEQDFWPDREWPDE